MEESIITSTQNAKVKHVVALQQKSALRRKEGLFVVEGRRELMHCIEAGYEVVETFMLADQTDLAEQDRLGNILTVSPQVYEKMAYRGSTEGVMAVVREKSLSLEELQLGLSDTIDNHIAHQILILRVSIMQTFIAHAGMSHLLIGFFCLAQRSISIA